MNVDGGGRNVYRLLNSGSKTDRSFTISYLFPNGNGGSLGMYPKALIVCWRPGEFVEDTIEGRVRNSGPQRCAEGQAGSSWPDEGIVIYFVESVGFADGSAYKDETTYKALRLYLQDLEKKSIEPIGNPLRRREVWTAGVQVRFC